ncbi:MAG: hypothetical protein AB7P20_01225 [Rhizobiaceae bacterium]
MPAARFLLPLVVCIVIATTNFGVTIGGIKPFTADSFATGYGGLIRFLFGLPGLIGDWTAILLAVVATVAAGWLDRTGRASLFFIGIVILPAMMFAARLPNLEFPRYFLVSGTLMLLLAGGLIGRGLANQGLPRIVASLFLVGMSIGNAISLAHFFELGRGSYSGIIATMGSQGPATYATGQDARLKRMVDYFAARKEMRLTLVKRDDWCGGRPQWLIIDEIDQPARVDADAACGLRFDRATETRHYGLSGANWTLYRRVD